MMYMQALLLASWASVSLAYYNWTKAATPANTYYWKGATISANGQYLVVSQAGNGQNGVTIHSKDYGVTWQTSNSVSYSSIVSDTSGKFIFAQGGYVSSDYGNTFSRPSNAPVGQVVSDYKGKNLIGVASASATQVVYQSQDGGYTWTQNSCPATAGLRFVASDSTGEHLMSVAETSEVYVSTDYGKTWARTAKTDTEFTGATYSGNGKFVYASTFDPSGPNGIYSKLVTSSDNGQTFQDTTFPSPTQGYTTVSVDSTGAIAAVVTGQGLYVTRDYGKTANRELTGSHWEGVAMTHDGSRIVAVASDQGGVYIGNWVN